MTTGSATDGWQHSRGATEGGRKTPCKASCEAICLLTERVDRLSHRPRGETKRTLEHHRALTAINHQGQIGTLEGLGLFEQTGGAELPALGR